MESVKCVCVGDGAVGNTCMLISYTTGSFPKEYVPTVFDNYQANVFVNGHLISLSLWDTAGQEEYDRMRPLSYPCTDVFIVCYSVTSPVSLDNAINKWIPEIRHYCPNTPFVLVGTKADIRKDLSAIKKLEATGRVCEFVDPTDAKQKGEELGAARVMECSAKTQEGLKNVWMRPSGPDCQPVSSVSNPRKGEKNACCCKLYAPKHFFVFSYFRDGFFLLECRRISNTGARSHCFEVSAWCVYVFVFAAERNLYVGSTKAKGDPPHLERSFRLLCRPGFGQCGIDVCWQPSGTFISGSRR